MTQTVIEPFGIERVSDFVTWYAARMPQAEALVLVDDLGGQLAREDPAEEAVGRG